MGNGDTDMKPPDQEIVNDPDKLLAYLRALWVYIMSNNIKVYNQNSEPTIGENQTAVWIDADGGPKYYVVANFDGTQKKGQLT